MRFLDGSNWQRPIFFLIVLVLLGSFTPLAATYSADTIASGGSSYRLADGTNEFGLWIGGSPGTAEVFGTTRDRELLLVALRYGRVFAAWESVSLQYTLDIFPAAVEFEPESVRGRSAIYGAGISPLGLKLNFGQESWIKPFIAASVGFLYFTHDVPVPNSSRFNFTPEVGLGAQFFLSPKTSLTLGYKFQHISNANTGHTNPGMDSNVIYAGFSFFTP